MNKEMAHFVKFHWKPVLGVHSLVWDEAQKIAGKNPDFHRHDLWEAIETGNYPEYEFGVQMIKEEDEFKFDFDILDPTKLMAGRTNTSQNNRKMTLNQNMDNFLQKRNKCFPSGACCTGN